MPTCDKGQIHAHMEQAWQYMRGLITDNELELQTF
jgi:hypothetical protein